MDPAVRVMSVLAAGQMGTKWAVDAFSTKRWGLVLGSDGTRLLNVLLSSAESVLLPLVEGLVL